MKMVTSFRLLAVLSLFYYTTAQPTTVELAFSPTDFPVEGGFTEGVCTFQTTTVGQTVDSVSWTHNVSLEVIGDGERVSVITTLSEGGTEGRSELVIDSVRPNDAGDYTCRVEFVGPSQLKTASAELSVASELVVAADSEQTAVEGGPAVLHCNVTSYPAPRIKWSRVEADGAETTLDNNQLSTDSDFGVFEVSSAVSVGDAGTYRCTGRYNFGVESRDIELVVLTVPVIATEVKEVTVVYTDTLHLNCSASGIKNPTYRWRFRNEDLVDGGRVELDSGNGDLWIGDLTYGDVGEYTCVAETGAGTDSITHTVAVEGKPEIQLSEGEELEVVVADNSLVEIECPFLSLPLPTVTWVKIQSDGRREEINSLAGGFTIFPANGSLLVWNVSQSQASHYDCILTNKHGSDNRTFFLRVIDLPQPPEGFSVVERGDHSVRLTWSPAPSSPTQPVEEYLLQLSYQERGTITSTRAISRRVTLYTADELVPGVTYTLVLMSSNLAGLSSPTPPLTHTTTSTVPRLDFFEAESLGDGRSILLQWSLLYSGGHPVNVFQIEVRGDGEHVETLRPDVYDDSLLLDDLRPSTEYSFEVVVGNALGQTTPLVSNASTPIAAPGKPTTPELDDRGPQSLTLSFSVKHGSYPIDYYLVLTTTDLSDPILNNTTVELSNTTEGLVNVSSGDVNSVVREDEWVEEGEVVGYHVILRVRGLRQRRSYVFSVAAASAVGLGGFSDPSQPYTLEDGELLLYLIVGGVLAGVVLVAVLLFLICCVGLYIRRQHQGGKITITRRGSDSTGVATDYNLRFESFNGGHTQGTTSPNPSQRVDSTTPPPRITSSHVTSPLLHTQHYYNSLRKYQLDTLPVGRHPGEERGSGRVVEVQILSNLHSNGLKNDSGDNMIDSGHYSHPTSHPPSLPPSSGSLPPPFLPPPSLPTSSNLPNLPSPTKHPSYNHPSSFTLYSVPRKDNSYPMQMSMSALPTADDGRSQVVGVASSGASTLPRGATTASDDYTHMQKVQGAGNGGRGNTGRRFRSMEPTTDPEPSKYESDGSLHSKHAGYQTDV